MMADGVSFRLGSSASEGGGGVVIEGNIESEIEGGHVEGWQALLTEAFRAKMLAIVCHALAGHALKGDALAGLGGGAVEIAVLFTSAARLKALNETYRGRSETTDILSFSSDDASGFLGDIAIAYEVLVAQADELSIALEDHCLHLILHGVLHVLGHDHEHEGAARAMERCERDILAVHGIADPYSVEGAVPCV